MTQYPGTYFNPTPPPPPSNQGGVVTAPAIAMLVYAILGFICNAWNFGGAGLRLAGVMPPQEIPAGLPPQWAHIIEIATHPGIAIITTTLALASNLVVLIGALRMKSLRSYGLAIAASILMMIPMTSWCCCAGLPIGIWALIVLLKPEVKAAFT